MQLINSKIIPSALDAFWEDLPGTVQITTGIACLVLTLPYPVGSVEEQTLLKMLTACQLAPEQYQILPIQAGWQPAWHKLRNTLKPAHVLLLGIAPEQLGIAARFQLHTPNHFDQCIFIPALSLTEMEKYPDAKKEFWTKGLKPVFAP